MPSSAASAWSVTKSAKTTSTMTATLPACATAWAAATVYANAGMTTSKSSINYTNNWWTQGNDPTTNSGAAGSGQPWTSQGACGAGDPPPPTPPPPPPPPPPPGAFSYSVYKDVGINMNWNTFLMSSQVTGTLSPITSVMPTKLKTITWAFATGECGVESWVGITRDQFKANVAAFVNAGKTYIVSTGGAAGSFTCGTDAGFTNFLDQYYSANLIGVDFDIESGQTQAQIDSLITRVKNAQTNPKYANLRFSFTVAVLGGTTGENLGAVGVKVINSIKAQGLSNYYMNLMVMDYGPATVNNCVLISGSSPAKCDMAASAIQAAKDLHTRHAVPYSKIELTPMIGGNDVIDETFTLADVTTMSNFVKTNGLAGVHFWSFDRDRDCPPGTASSTCNTYGAAGTLGFTNAFISALGL
ncbi:MAG: glycosyl hydrolase [Glaciimonas sp.]|nr:glycosyl hydrolase [Glaciimonas sp.]